MLPIGVDRAWSSQVSSPRGVTRIGGGWPATQARTAPAIGSSTTLAVVDRPPLVVDDDLAEAVALVDRGEQRLEATVVHVHVHVPALAELTIDVRPLGARASSFSNPCRAGCRRRVVAFGTAGRARSQR